MELEMNAAPVALRPYSNRESSFDTDTQRQRRRHDQVCHVLCRKCARRSLLGETAFKFYLLIAWCIGLAGIMATQHKNVFFSIFLMIYLISQIFGLLAAISHLRKLFIPYVLALTITIFANISLILNCFLRVSLPATYEKSINKNEVMKSLNVHFFRNALISMIFAFIFLIYNMTCLLSVLHQCSEYEKQRQRNERLRRDLLVRNAMIYERLMALNRRNLNQTVVSSVNPDSPPKYSSLETKCLLESPPPRYSQLQKMMDSDEFKI